MNSNYILALALILVFLGCNTPGKKQSKAEKESGDLLLQNLAKRVPSDVFYLDISLSFEKRAQDLLSRMTLDEKIDQLSMKSLNRLKLDDKGEVTK